MDIYYLLTQVIGAALVISGVYDGYKYHWLSVAIRKAGTAKGQSRKFVNAALAKDIIIFLYMILKFDLYILLMTFVGFIFTIELLITIYYFYPYRYRNLLNWKRPSLIIYIINSWMPNSLRRKL
jgi:hypothetical protein